MKYVALALLILPSFVYAGSPSCDKIQNADDKYYCLGTTNKDKNACNNISNADAKYMCIAIAADDRSACNSIGVSMDRLRCLSTVK